MKLYQVVFTFLDPSKAMGTVAANSEEEAKEKIRADIEENNPQLLETLVFESVIEVADSPILEDISEDRTLN